MRKATSTEPIGLHFAAAEAIGEYIEQAGLKSGPLFRPQLNSRSRKLAKRAMDPKTMYRLIQGYLEKLPGSIREAVHPDGSITTQIYDKRRRSTSESASHDVPI
jgi:hypothetical protein